MELFHFEDSDITPDVTPVDVMALTTAHQLYDTLHHSDDTLHHSDDTLHHSGGLQFSSASEDESDVLPRRGCVDDYEQVRLVGRGGYGKVYAVRERSSGRVYAMKALRKQFLIEKKCVGDVHSERDVMRVVRHPHVVRLRATFQDSSRVYLIMDYVQGGQLLRLLRSEAMFSEAWARFYLGQLVLALQHLHGLGIVHRDLKPENILLDQRGNLQLTDFGLAKMLMAGESTSTWVGTLEYMAPEMLMGQEYGTAVDVWSAGVLLFDMLTGAPPWRSNNDAALKKKILSAKLSIPRYISPPTASLIRKMLTRNPAQRISLKALRTHPFFNSQGFSWKALERGDVSPPFVPDTADIPPSYIDTSYYDDVASQAASSVHSCDLPSQSQDELFCGFSWQPNSAISHS